ncbi:translation initiation factor IF-2 subunit alpha [Desulfurococcaceae archaeon MEX13E-LK6-19]|nr:translation initiation factor IF-2 subunit alpha [Desulfurococcaceae archaeon MEX13E-LK6-19]
MLKPRKELPHVGEYVVATVKEIFDYGAYVTLDEYGGLQAYLPWSEVSTRWVRNIRDVIREGQKIVVKVIRVNRHRKTVDVSLKKVSDSDRRKKMMWWKRYVKAAKIVEIVAQKIGKPIDEAYEKVIWKLEDYYGDPLYGLEEAVLRGPEALREAGVPEDWIEPLMQEINRHIKIKKVRIRGTFILRSLKPYGVEDIKKILLTIPEVAKKFEKVSVKVYTLGAPRYVVEVEAPDYKIAEKALSAIVEQATTMAKDLGVEAKFEREKR